ENQMNRTLGSAPCEALPCISWQPPRSIGNSFPEAGEGAQIVRRISRPGAHSCCVHCCSVLLVCNADEFLSDCTLSTSFIPVSPSWSSGLRPRTETACSSTRKSRNPQLSNHRNTCS